MKIVHKNNNIKNSNRAKYDVLKITIIIRSSKVIVQVQQPYIL